MKKEFLTLLSIPSADRYITLEKMYAMLPELRRGNSPFAQETIDITKSVKVAMYTLLGFGNEMLNYIRVSAVFNFRQSDVITNSIN